MKPVRILIAVLLLVFTLTDARAEEVNAGPIWNNSDAQRKCPGVCGSRGWDGNWHTTAPGSAPVRNLTPFCPMLGHSNPTKDEIAVRSPLDNRFPLRTNWVRRGERLSSSHGRTRPTLPRRPKAQMLPALACTSFVGGSVILSATSKEGGFRT